VLDLNLIDISCLQCGFIVMEHHVSLQNNSNRFYFAPAAEVAHEKTPKTPTTFLSRMCESGC
jgi:hypothetical protein